MKSVSNAFKTSAIAPVKTVGATVTVYDGGQTLISFTEDNYLQSVTLESTGELFGSVATQATIKLLGDDYDYEGKQVSILYSLNTADGIESINYGLFTIVEQKVSKNKDYTEFTAWNKTLELGDTNYSEITGFPMSVADMASVIATRGNFTINSMTSLPNYNFSIAEDLYKNISGATYRSVLAEIAGATGSMAVFDNSTNILTFRPYQSTVQQALNYEYLKSYTIGEKYGAINSLVLSRTPQEDNIAVKDQTMIDSPSGKNLFNYTNYTASVVGLTVSLNTETGEFTVSGVPTTNYANFILPIEITDMLEDGATYTISGRSTDGKVYCQIRANNSGGNVYYATNGTGSATFTVNKTTYPNYYINAQTVRISDWGTESLTETAKFQLEKGTSASTFETFKSTGVKECKIANNEIMDDDRTTVITPLFNAINGMTWYGFEVETVGLGWLECGDRVQITDSDSNTIDGIITYIKIVIDGGVKETIKGVPPIETETNYALAGGITKTIYNTEIKVDKQNQEIQSIVSEQTSFENETLQNFTNITQNISSVVTSVQSTGGNNLIKNSAFYTSDDDGNFTNWTYSTAPVVQTSAEASVHGSLSGQIIDVSNTTISQIIAVKSDDSTIAEADKTYYSFGFRAVKSASGTASVTLTDGTTEGVWTKTFANGTSADWEEFSIDKMLPQSNNLTLTVTASSDSGFKIMDMIVNAGEYHTQWQQASGEANNTQVSITTDGIVVKNGNTATNYTKHTNQGFFAYKNRSISSSLDADEVIAPKAEFTSQITMPPIKIISQSDGWAFVKTE